MAHGITHSMTNIERHPRGPAIFRTHDYAVTPVLQPGASREYGRRHGQRGEHENRNRPNRHKRL
jgi:hypothetical protein